MDASLLLWCLFDHYVTLGDPTNHTLMRCADGSVVMMTASVPSLTDCRSRCRLGKFRKFVKEAGVVMSGQLSPNAKVQREVLDKIGLPDKQDSPTLLPDEVGLPDFPQRKTPEKASDFEKAIQKGIANCRYIFNTVFAVFAVLAVSALLLNSRLDSVWIFAASNRTKCCLFSTHCSGPVWNNPLHRVTSILAAASHQRQ